MPKRNNVTEVKSDRIALLATIVKRLAESPMPFGVSELARSLSRNKVYVHRLLSSLESIGWVSKDPLSQKYKAGNELLNLGLLLISRSPLSKITLSYLYELSYITNETTALCIRIGYERVFIQHIPAKHDNHQAVVLGQYYPLWLGATGKAMAAFLDDEEIDELIEIMRREQPTLKMSVVFDIDQYRNQLKDIRAKGYAISVGEYTPDVCVLAAPIFDQRRTVVASIIVRGKAPSFDRETAEKYSAAISKMANDISGQIQT
jgi:IclR family KDG regulon transcriptional repressor